LMQDVEKKLLLGSDKKAKFKVLKNKIFAITLRFNYLDIF